MEYIGKFKVISLVDSYLDWACLYEVCYPDATNKYHALVVLNKPHEKHELDRFLLYSDFDKNKNRLASEYGCGKESGYYYIIFPYEKGRMTYSYLTEADSKAFKVMLAEMKEWLSPVTDKPLDKPATSAKPVAPAKTAAPASASTAQKPSSSFADELKERIIDPDVLARESKALADKVYREIIEKAATDILKSIKKELTFLAEKQQYTVKNGKKCLLGKLWCSEVEVPYKADVSRGVLWKKYLPEISDGSWHRDYSGDFVIVYLAEFEYEHETFKPNFFAEEKKCNERWEPRFSDIGCKIICKVKQLALKDNIIVSAEYDSKVYSFGIEHPRHPGVTFSFSIDV